ncbi:PepSY domain-containing protein [Peribacillus loiseleuriae]|uniref:PepSY domain-containing protein n=1 Tax=Peribacillus loiseleuriae TaxID=1679170 RepID=UPI003D0563C0
MQLITKLLTGAIVIGGLGASAYALTGNEPTTPQIIEPSPKNVTAQTITEQKANELALKATKGGIVTNTHLEEDTEGKKFEVIIVKPDKKFEVDIDAQTGNVIEIDQYLLGEGELKVEVNNHQNVSPNISLAHAKELALDQVRGTITEADLQYFNNRLVYNFEISTADHREAEVTVDATDGTVLKVDELK